MRPLGAGQQRGVGPGVIEVDSPGGHAGEQEQHHRIEEGGMTQLVQHPAEHDQHGAGEKQDAHAGEQVGPGGGVLIGMGRVGGEEAAADAGQVLDAHEPRDRAAGDRPLIGEVNGAVEGHGRAGGKEENPDEQARRRQDIDNRAPEIDVEVAQEGIAAQTANHADEGAKADSAAEKHVTHDDRELAEVRQVDLAGVVLLAVVGDEGDDRVKDGGRGQHVLVVGVEREDRLQCQDNIADGEEQDVEEEQVGGVLFPGLRAGVEARLDPAQPGGQAGAIVQDVGEVEAGRQRQAQSDQENHKGKQPHKGTSLLALLQEREWTGDRIQGNPAEKEPPVASLAAFRRNALCRRRRLPPRTSAKCG